MGQQLICLQKQNELTNGKEKVNTFVSSSKGKLCNIVFQISESTLKNYN